MGLEDGMIVGLGTGSTAALAVEALARRHRQGLRFAGTAAQAVEGEDTRDSDLDV